MVFRDLSFRDLPQKKTSHKVKNRKKTSENNRFIKVSVKNKLSLLPRKSIPEKVRSKIKSFCKQAVFAVKKVISFAKRAAQCILLLAKYIFLLVKCIVQCIILAAKRIFLLADYIFFLAKRTVQYIILLTKYIWPVIKIIFPPLITGALVFTALNGSGLIRVMTDDLAPVTGIIPAALLLLVISLIPVISPLVGPGIIIAVFAVILTGEQIAAGAVTPLMALPAFCAIDVLIGCKIIPRAFAVGETEPKTINAGVPVVFFTRLVTIPAAVAVAYLFSFILFQS